MDKARKPNLIINGIGSSNGGTVHLARIDGIGRIDGDLHCNDFFLNGKAEINGRIQAALVDINGHATIEESLHAAKLKVNGKIMVAANIKSDQIQLKGSAIIKGSCEAEIFEVEGKLQIHTLLADRIQINLHGSSQIAEIGGERIHIRKKRGIDFAKWFKALPLPLGNNLKAETIEGDYVYIEHTSCAIVRGEEVSIGPGCDIDAVEYKTTFKQDHNSIVRKLTKIV